jgi:hypothetical protein
MTFLPGPMMSADNIDGAKVSSSFDHEQLESCLEQKQQTKIYPSPNKRHLSSPHKLQVHQVSEASALKPPSPTTA